MDSVSEKGLSSRILGIFIFTTSILVLQGIYNIYSLDGVNDSIAKVYVSVNQVSATASDISLPITELRQLSMSLVMAPNNKLRDQLKTQITELQDKTNLSLDDDHKLKFSDSEAKELFLNIKAAWQGYSTAVNVTMDYVNEGVRIAEFISVTIYEKKAYDKVTTAIVAYNAYQLKTSAVTYQAAQDNARIAFWAVLITTVIEVAILKFILAYVLNLVRQYVAAKKQHKQEEKVKNEALEQSAQLKALLKERTIAEKKINNLKNYLANIIDSMPSVLIGVDQNGLVTQWNHAAQQATGISVNEAQGQSLINVFPGLSAEMEQVRKSIETRKELSDLKMPYQREGNAGFEDVTIYPLISNGVEGAVIRLDDVTDKVRLEGMMVQSEKMLSVGGLAAGMAHEINNPLAGMMQTANVLHSRLTEKDMPANQKAAQAAGINMDDLYRYMESRGMLRMIKAINDSGHRIEEIVDNMLSFARKTDVVISSHDLAELMDRTLELAATDYDLKKQYDFKTIKLVKKYADNIPSVPCEGSPVQQVFLNILRNGAQAMQDAKVEGAQFTLQSWLDTDKNRVCISIEDNGPGMDGETRKRIYEPFFTTKPVGEGTGLGLSVSYFIICENHGGELEVETSPGNGCRFIIGLPMGGKEALS